MLFLSATFDENYFFNKKNFNAGEMSMSEEVKQNAPACLTKI